MVSNSISCDDSPTEDEPKLKYVHIENDLPNILEDDGINCIRVHTKFVCLGTKKGAIHLLDHDGNIARLGHNGSAVLNLQVHKLAVNEISVDLNGDYIASCSDDGEVLVQGLHLRDSRNLSLGTPVKSVALDPYYNRSGSARRFLIGLNSKLLLYEKTFFNRLRATALSQCDGQVQGIAWHEQFVAWFDKLGVHVYDITTKYPLGLIEWEKSLTHPTRDIRSNLLWTAEETLMIGWADTIKVYVVREKSQTALQKKNTAECLLDAIHTFQIKYNIYGFGPFNDHLVVLGFPKKRDVTEKSHKPIFTIVDYKDTKITEVSADNLDISGYEDYTCNDYHLGTLIEENRYFIVSPKEVIIATPFDIDDRIEWLITHGRIEKAISVLEKVGACSKYSIATVGVQYLDHLLSENQFEKAAVLCARVCKNDKALWERQITKFEKADQLRVITSYIPIKPENALSSEIYEKILYEYLIADSKGFLKLIHEWNTTLYRVKVIIKVLLDHLLVNDEDKSIYLEALALLYCNEKKYDYAIKTYLKIQNNIAFDLIVQYNMYNAVDDKILELMSLDCDKAVDILINKSKIPIDKVQKQLETNDLFLYKYLDAYSTVNTKGRYHENLVKLYAKYNRDKLLPLLKSSDDYNIKEALDICKKSHFYTEMVFLLGRIGDLRKALHIIINQLDDINEAINFCQEHNDKELWADLIIHTINKPDHVTVLLKRIGNYYDPRMLVQSIKPGSEIKDLQKSLVKMVHDYHLQLSVRKTCKAITLRNYFEMHEKLFLTQQKGISITDDFFCGVCQGRIIIKGFGKLSNLKIYNCKHSFHEDCLAGGTQCDDCTVCSTITI